MQLLSNRLWAAWGVNRKIGPFGVPGRTAASASNSQEIDLYVAVREGVYLYNALDHLLAPIVAGDLRTNALTPGQRGIEAKAPVQLIYVVDVHRLTHTAGFQEPGLQDPEVQKSYYYVDTGLIASNVYLFAASQSLAVWFHNCDKATLTERLGLRAEQRVLFAQSVGYPEKERRRADAAFGEYGADHRGWERDRLRDGRGFPGGWKHRCHLRSQDRTAPCGPRKHPELQTVACDVSSEEDRKGLVDWTVVHLPGLNVLVNNAGVQRDVDFTKGIDDFLAGENEIRINLEAAIVLTGLFVPRLAKNKGAAIVYVSSGLGFVPAAGMPVYSASKAGIHAYSMAVRRQLSKVGIKVFEVVPPRGRYRTQFKWASQAGKLQG